MAITAFIYSNCPLNALEKVMNLETDTIKCMLCTSSYTPDQDNHDFKDDVTNEVSGSGYTAGGAEVANPSVTVSGRVTTFDGDDVSWSNSTITARYAVLYDDTPSGDSSKPLIMCINFGEDKSSENGTFQITFNASGIFTITVPTEG